MSLFLSGSCFALWIWRSFKLEPPFSTSLHTVSRKGSCLLFLSGSCFALWNMALVQTRTSILDIAPHRKATFRWSKNKHMTPHMTPIPNLTPIPNSSANSSAVPKASCVAEPCITWGSEWGRV